MELQNSLTFSEEESQKVIGGDQGWNLCVHAFPFVTSYHYLDVCRQVASTAVTVLRGPLTNTMP